MTLIQSKVSYQSNDVGSGDPFLMDLSSFRVSSDASYRRNDRGVRPLHTILEGEKILLTVTASVAAYRAPHVIRTLRSFGAHVDVCVTERAASLVGLEALAWAAGDGKVYSTERVTGKVEHLNSYSLYLVAPASYDFINGMATGRADTLPLTTMAAALGRVESGAARMLVAPCMNGDMANSLLLGSMRSLARLNVDFLQPRQEDGKLKLPRALTIAVGAARVLSRSPLKGKSILVTGGPTPVEIDKVRLLTNKYTGKLGCEIARELAIRGANPQLLLGGQLEVPSFLLPYTSRHATYNQYREKVLKIAESDQEIALAVLSAAVADYHPVSVFPGKIPSKQPSLHLPELVPTEKVVDLFHERRSDVPIVSFKLLSGVTEEELIAEAQRRLSTHSEIVIANLEEECLTAHQVVRIVSKEGCKKIGGSKRRVARAIVDSIEEHIRREWRNV